MIMIPENHTLGSLPQKRADLKRKGGWAVADLLLSKIKVGEATVSQVRLQAKVDGR